MTDTARVDRYTRSDRSQEGFTVVEVMVAAVVVAVGVLGLLGALDSSGRLTAEAKRTEQATAVGQQAIAPIKALAYAQIALTTKPVWQATGPNSKVSGTNFTSGPPVSAEALLDGGVLAAGPEAFSSGGTTGQIYRYVTERTECGLTCLDVLRSKRVTVAVWLDSERNRRAPPVFVSTIVTDPSSGPLGVNVPPDASLNGVGLNPSTVTAQPFYLTDTRCDQNTRQPITGAHAVHDTTAATAATGCSAVLNAARGDLMHPDAPPDTTDPVFDVSSDLARTAPVGLALQRVSTSCSTTGTKFQVHTWATAPLPLAFAVVGRSAVSLQTKTVNGVSADVTLCVTLRAQTASLVTTPVATTTYHLADWPTVSTPIAFAFDNLVVPAVPLGGRLLLTVSVKSTSGADIELLYDHPDARSFLSVSTTTPLP